MNSDVAVVDSSSKGRLSLMISRIRSLYAERGLFSTLLVGLQSLFHPIVRHRRRLIWEAPLRTPRSPSKWEPLERLIVVGPDNLEKELTPALRSFLGGDGAAKEVAGVCGGDRLFVVTRGVDYLAYSYIFLHTTRATRRQARILGETKSTPIIGISFTTPAARGRGIYRRVLNEMFRYLDNMGYERAVCEVDPTNISSNSASQKAGMHVCRELRDWTIVNRLVVQRVCESGRCRWRMLWIS